MKDFLEEVKFNYIKFFLEDTFVLPNPFLMKTIIQQFVPTIFFMCIVLILATSCSKEKSTTVYLFYNQSNPEIEFGLEKVEEKLDGIGLKIVKQKVPFSNLPETMTSMHWYLGDNPDEFLDNASIEPVKFDLNPEGFVLQTHKEDDQKLFSVTAADMAGTMYGCLELAEQLELYGIDGVMDKSINPYMEKRGVKFNIPLDVRTPSYSDMSDAGQKNIDVVWDLDFWKDFIDEIAGHRYNFVSLWSLHPFPSMVKVPDYPDVALSDVMRSTTEWKEYYSTRAQGYDIPEIMDSLEIVKKMTMDEKIAFWKSVMAYGKTRNVDFYIVTWNIFDYGTEGKYGITDDMNNATTIDYFRKSVKEMFVAYPDLAGMGLTTGENMPAASFEEKENWAYETYGKGVSDAAELFPDRKITFIHRQHQAGASDIAKKFQPLLDHDNVDFIFSFKYAQAHVYSSTTQHFHPNFVGDIGDMKTIWTLRNDDIYLYRWGSANYVREFIENIPYEVGRGYYYGSDQYIWGKEFHSKHAELSGELEIKKHWYQWLLWGRLGYEPGLSNDRLTNLVGSHFPEIDEKSLVEAWHNASMIYPITTGFHWGEFDFQWYIEACKSRPGPAQTVSGFHDVNRFITLPPHASTDYISIPDFVNAWSSNEEISGVSPGEVSQLLHQHADSALKFVNEISDVESRELQLTISDIATMAQLGKYYGFKIQGALSLALYRSTHDKKHQEEAIANLTFAANHWKKYVTLSSSNYNNPFWTNRVGHVDWEMLSKEVDNDITIALQEE